MKQYIKYIAYLQVIGIILVVLGHSFHEYPDGCHGDTLLLKRMIYSFHMPLFMFVSGFLMIFTTRMRSDIAKVPRISTFVKKKILRLLLPYIVLTLVTFVPRSALSIYADDNVSLSLESVYRSLMYTGSLVIPFFWFLQASFILLVFNYIFITLGEKARINKIVIYSCLIILFVALQPISYNFENIFSIHQALELGLYFVLGAAYCQFNKKFNSVIPWTSTIFIISEIFVWCVLFFVTEETKWLPLCSITGILMCISVARLIEKHNIKILDHLIGANYMIFLLSWYFNIASQQILSHFIELPWWIYTALSLITGIYIPWLGYRYIQAHPESRWVRITAFLLGQSVKQQIST